MIRVLDKNVADKIAAGEVIDRPVSIVKELVENALDAEASSVTVELRKGGKEYLRVTDDGCGIPAEDTERAFLRHATSKISSEQDLDAIHSLGFRGEALASICAVARVEMITKTASEHAGRRVICEGSEILQNAPFGCPEGTTITVRDLFYNVPARKKFLASDGAEARRIIDMMSRIALAYPDVRFRLINGKQEVFQTAGSGSILDNICRIYGRDMGRDLIKVDTEGGGHLLRGFVSSPGTTTTSRNRQFFCVNGRVVSSRTMERGLEKAYRERLFPGRFPIAFLFLQMPADQLDVNVHPTKKEIRFDNEFMVEDFITEAITQVLQQRLAIPPVTVPAGQDPAKKPETPASQAASKEMPLHDGGAPDAPDVPAPDPAGTEPAGEASGNGTRAPQRSNADPEASDPEASSGEQVDIKNLLQNMRQEQLVQEKPFTYDEKDGVRSPEEEARADAQEHPKAEAKPEHLELTELEVLGAVFQTYIVAAAGDTMYLIDQHAAHERVFYERLLLQYHSEEKLSQQLLIPLQISVSAEVEYAEDAWIGHLRQMGYDIENFGARMYIVRALPAFAKEGEGERFLRDLLLGMEESPDLRSFAGLDQLIMRSCKSAVKGGDTLHEQEIQELLRQLADCDNPWSCPHGRPTIIRLTKRDLERMFKR